MYEVVSSLRNCPVDSMKVSCLLVVLSFQILLVSPRIPMESQESILGLDKPPNDRPPPLAGLLLPLL